jgi:hypothetical protein
MPAINEKHLLDTLGIFMLNSTDDKYKKKTAKKMLGLHYHLFLVGLAI